jgi:methylated-DNA-protein-cysteine methyltransferase-like protein
MVATAVLTTVQQREQAVIAAVRAVPRGEIASYGDIARRAGLPGRARLVGRVLRITSEKNLPWHRVTGACGRIAFAPGSALAREQARRLKREGLTVIGNRVRLPRFDASTLDAAVWAPVIAQDSRRER